VDEATWLHDAARRYFAYRRRSRELQGDGPGVGLRWSALRALEVDVESLTGVEAPLDEMRALLGAAGGRDLDDGAARDERARFLAFVATHVPGPGPLLPYRRTLTAAEHDRLRAAIEDRWGVWNGGCVEVARAPTVTLHVAAMTDAVCAALRTWAAGRVLEARELGPGRELDASLAEFVYDIDGEGWWVPPALDWLIYVSHEASITFGGDALCARVREVLRGFDRYVYRGWDLADYDLPR
jgi:hypothetical protein